MMRSKNDVFYKEDGNVLLLALIACVLFVALIYVVVQSFSVSDEPDHTINFDAASSVTQYSSALRTGVTRMLLRDVPLDQLDFSIPDADQDIAADAASDHVFHAAGGGVTYAPIAADGIVNTIITEPETFHASRNGNWYFMPLGIQNIGTSKKELVALLYDVTKKICEDINYQITGNSTIPELKFTADEILHGRVNLAGPTINGQPFLCIHSQDAYIYYHVLAEQ